MAATLPEILLAPDVRPRVTADSLTLIDSELADKSGISGNAIKLAYKTVSGFASGYIRETVDKMLPEIADQLQPYWADFTASGGAQFGDYLAKRGDEVAKSLLSISDAMAERSNRPVVVRAYRAVHAGAARHIQAALPRVGDLVTTYAG
jgi:alkylhydroperoxidase/carboxymuconolactone decarboxylase family protein YurZ